MSPLMPINPVRDDVPLHAYRHQMSHLMAELMARLEAHLANALTSVMAPVSSPTVVDCSVVRDGTKLMAENMTDK